MRDVSNKPCGGLHKHRYFNLPYTIQGHITLFSCCTMMNSFATVNWCNIKLIRWLRPLHFNVSCRRVAEFHNCSDRIGYTESRPHHILSVSPPCSITTPGATPCYSTHALYPESGVFHHKLFINVEYPLNL